MFVRVSSCSTAFAAVWYPLLPVVPVPDCSRMMYAVVKCNFRASHVRAAAGVPFHSINAWLYSPVIWMAMIARVIICSIVYGGDAMMAAT